MTKGILPVMVRTLLGLSRLVLRAGYEPGCPCYLCCCIPDLIETTVVLR